MSKFYRFKEGKLLINAPDALDAHEAYEKGLPPGLDHTRYEWLTNFGFKNVKGKTTAARYVVQIEEKPGKAVVYWDGEKVVQLAGKDLSDATHGGRKYKTFSLDLADPPVGWVN